MFPRRPQSGSLIDHFRTSTSQALTVSATPSPFGAALAARCVTAEALSTRER